MAELLHDSPYTYSPGDLGIGRLFWKVREAVIVADADTGRVVLWNPSAEKLFGYSAAEARGLPLEGLIPVGLRKGPGAYPDTGETVEVPAIRKTGEELWIELSLIPLVDVAVDGRFVLALARDLTERKRGEEANDRLAREQAARMEAEAAVRARDELLAMAAHELKAPLTGLRGYAQLLRRQLGKGAQVPTERLDRALAAIEEQSGTVVRLVERPLEVSRSGGGGLSLAREPTELVGLVERVAAAARVRTESHSLTVRASPPAVRARVDPLRLEQVLTNLLDNAIKYSPAGGEVTVEVSQPDPKAVRVAVEDQGPGIPPQERERIFERYHRGHAAAHRSGLGLGLYISRRIVEQHGGRITVETPDGAGSRFVVTLPIGPEAAMGAVTADAPARATDATP